MFERLPLGIGQSRGRVGRFLIVCMVLGFAALIATGLAAALSTARNQQHVAWVNHTYEVELAILRVGILVEQSETPRRGYIITGDPEYLAVYQSVSAQFPAALARVERLTHDNPVQRARVAQMRDLTTQLKIQRDATNALVASGQVDAARKRFLQETTIKRMAMVRTLSRAMVTEEQRLLALRDADQRASIRTFYTTLIVAGVLLILVALASLATVLRYTRDLSDSHETLRDFADSLEDLVQERTADLTRANEEIQRFAYIVSHDLRSPLVNVMGFTAELEGAIVTIGDLIDRAEQRAPDIVSADVLQARDDLPEAIGFIRTSTHKMDRLINAILKLAREGRRVIAAEPLDMAEVVRGIGASLTQQLEQRGATVSVEHPLPGIVSDRLAIEQIFSNLIENAVKYLSPDRAGRIIVRGRQIGPRVVFEVEDNGRGIAVADHQRVFDLFRRAGNQDQPGEGIGLAHVRALAYRLGGIIDVSSELGRGATFRLTLPATFIEQAPREN